MQLTSLTEKYLTIPKNELRAAVIASRLKIKIFEKTRLNLPHIYCWTDTKTALKYLPNECKKCSVYIMHRISDMRTNAEIKDWDFVSGALNISHHCTQSLSFEDLAKENSYLEKPKFLFEPLQNV